MKHGHSNLDLVIAIKHCDCATAARWIAERFAVPRAKVGRPRGSRATHVPSLRAGLNGEMEVLVRSGVYGQLDPGPQAVLVTLFHFRDPDTGLTQLSYRGIAVYSGVESPATISKALKFLRRIHAIQILQTPRLGITRPCNQYRVTLEDEQFLALCNEKYRALRESTEKERAICSEKRFAREIESQLARKVQSETSLMPAGDSAPRTPRSIPFQEENQKEEQKHSCKGLNLSSVIEVNSDLSLHSLKRAIKVISKEKAL